MDIFAGLAAASSAIDIAKAMRAAEKDFDAAVYLGQVTDLTIALSDAKMALVEARDQMAGQAAEIERLKAVNIESGDLVRMPNGFNYQKNTAGEISGWPICPTCLSRESRIVHLVSAGTVRMALCPRCQTKFEGVAHYVPKGDGTLTTTAEIERERQNAAIAAARPHPRTAR